MASTTDDQAQQARSGAPADQAEAARPRRPLPTLDEVNRDFWTGGADGELRIARCRACGFYVNPPAPVCPRCYGRDLRAEAVSGRGEVYTFTVNRHPWLPSIPPPYVLALIELEEQEGLRVFSNVVDCDVDDVRIGLPVEVRFIEQDDVYLPVFRPRGAA